MIFWFKAACVATGALLILAYALGYRGFDPTRLALAFMCLAYVFKEPRT